MKALILSLIFSFPVFAQNCPTTNLITEPDSPFNKIPVYDQDGIGICYAYVASQMADFHLIKKGSSQRVHPLWAAMKYSESKNRLYLSNGIAYDSIMHIKAKGNCHSNYISEQLSKLVQKGKIQEVDVMSLIEVFAGKMESLYQTKSNVTDQDVEDVILSAITYQQPYCSPGATLEALIPELKALSVTGSRAMLGQLIFPGCQNTEKLDVPDPDYFVGKTPDELTAKLKQQLLSSQAPVAVSYCSKVLFDPSYTGNAKSPDCGNHLSMVVGMKEENNQCQLLLRNTWGAGFGRHTENWKCLCKHKLTNEVVDNCTEKTHNNGLYAVEACWIDEGTLAKNAYALQFLKAK